MPVATMWLPHLATEQVFTFHGEITVIYDFAMAFAMTANRAILSLAVVLAAAASQAQPGALTSTNAAAHAAPATVTNGLDLIEAKLDGRPIKNLTLEQVTDIYGRPDAVEEAHPKADGQAWAKGAAVIYHEKGLRFDFRHPSSDKDQHVVNVTVHLSKKWDSKLSAFYGQYTGTLSRDVNGGWKFQKVMEKFSDCKLEDVWETQKQQRETMRASEARLAALEKQAAKLGVAPMHLPSATANLEEIDSQILATFDSHMVQFQYERTTRFLETITVMIKENAAGLQTTK